MARWGICPGPEQTTAAPWATNGGMWDLFSLVHGLGGAVLGAVGLGLGPVVGLAVTWELVEHLLKDCIPDSFVHPTQDSLRNSVTDVVMVLLGWVPGRWARERRLAASAR